MLLEPIVVGAQSVVPNLSAKRAVGAFADFRANEALLIEDGKSCVKPQVKSPHLFMKDEFRQTRKNPIKEKGNENRVTVRFTGDVDRDGGIQPYVRFRDKDNFDVTGDILFSETEESVNTFIYSVPTSVYDIQIGWSENEPGVLEKHRCFIVWEGVAISENQEFIVSREDAPNSIHFKFQLPNGETPKWPVVMLDEENNLVRDWTGANVGNTLIANMVCHPDYGALTTDGVTFNCVSDGSVMAEYDSDKDCIIWVNDMSKDMWITQHIVMENEQGEIYSAMASAEIKSGENIVEVGCDGYHKVEEEFEHTPFAFSEIGGSDVYSYTIEELIMNIPGFSFPFNVTKGNECSLYVKNEPYEVEGVNLTYTPITVTNYDWEKKTTSFWGGERVEYIGIKSPEIVVQNGRLSYLNTAWDDFGYNYVFRAPIGGYEKFPGLIPKTNTHPVFSYPVTLRGQKLGDNAPILSVVTIDYGVPESRLPIGFPAIKGRYGESRIIDLDLLETTLSIEGEKMYEGSYNDYVGYMFDGYSNAPTGSVEIVFNDKNVGVDGLEGKNVTEIGYEKDGEDVWAPTLQMLHFQDSEGFITDRFETAKDGTLEFAGGDFIEHFNEENYYWYTEEEADVEVEYAPYGSEEFSPLDVKEIPELYFMPGFGHFYRGELSGVDRESETGWFDLRIKLTDKAGNYQRQLISPAFKIGSLMSGISTTGKEDVDVRVEGHNIIVPAGSVIYNTQGLVTNGCNVSPGIYVVKTPAGVRKVNVR